MKRSQLLYEITGLMGEVIADCNVEGVPLDERTVRIFADRFCDKYKALEEIPAYRLAQSVQTDETQHGGLLRRETLHLANVTRKA